MAVKGGDLLSIGNQVLINRLQTAGPGQVNINRTKVYELGNYFSVGQVSDIPDMTFTLEGIDASAEMEALLTGKTFAGMPDGTEMKPSNSIPIDVMSAFKPGRTATNAYSEIGSVAIPYLTLESLSYRFGISDNAAQTATLKGDSIYYNPATCYIEEFAGTNAANQTVTPAHLAVPYNGDTTAGTRYAISISLSTGGSA